MPVSTGSTGRSQYHDRRGPVEYQVAGIVQGNVNPKVGVTFSSGLRTLLRQDPDVILIGESRYADVIEHAEQPATARASCSLTGDQIVRTSRCAP